MGLFTNGNTSFGPVLWLFPSGSGSGNGTSAPLYPTATICWVYFGTGLTISTPLIHSYGGSSHANCAYVVSGNVYATGGTYDNYPGTTSGLLTTITGNPVTTGAWCMIGASYSTTATQLYCYNSVSGKEYYSTGSASTTASPMLNQYWFNGNGATGTTGTLYAHCATYLSSFNGQGDFTLLAKGLNPIDFARETKKTLYIYCPLKGNLQQYGCSYPVYPYNRRTSQPYNWGMDAPVNPPKHQFLVPTSNKALTGSTLPFFT
jgi:hypothetical protein